MVPDLNDAELTQAVRQREAGHENLYCGCPRFEDTELARIQREEGDGAAWRRAFSLYGSKAPDRVSGAFAVAQKLDDGRVFLAVDRFSIHSLCYRLVNGALSFASRADEVGGTDIDPQAIFDYFYFHVIPSPRTIFRDVFRLPAAHCAVFENGKLTVAPYWVASFEEPRSGDFSALKAEFLGLVEASVKDQVGAGRIGCFLSGGTDSSTVAGMLCKSLGQPVPAYSIGFDAQGYDEMEYARLAARHFGVDHHEYYVTPEDVTRSIPAVAAHYDQPFGNSSALAGYYCAKVARDDGIDKLLAGDGGDELFGGNSRYAKQRIFDWYQLFPGLMRRGLMEPLSPLVRGVPLLKKVDSYIEQAKVPMPGRMHMDSLLGRLGPANIFTPAMLKAFDLGAPARHQQAVWDEAHAGSLINRMLAFDWRYTLAENDLPKVCGTTSLAGVEVGFPLLDQRILDFSLGLPPEFKLKGLKLRWFFKEALRGFLPDDIITKKKHGFGLPFGVWSMRHEPLRKLAEESVQGLADRGIVRPEFIRKLLTELLPAYPGYYGEMVWIMMMMEQWLRAHVPSGTLLPQSR